jgi:hypothetical protein
VKVLLFVLTFRSVKNSLILSVIQTKLAVIKMTLPQYVLHINTLHINTSLILGRINEDKLSSFQQKVISKAFSLIIAFEDGSLH